MKVFLCNKEATFEGLCFSKEKKRKNITYNGVLKYLPFQDIISKNCPSIYASEAKYKNSVEFHERFQSFKN